MQTRCATRSEEAARAGRDMGDRELGPEGPKSVRGASGITISLQATLHRIEKHHEELVVAQLVEAASSRLEEAAPPGETTAAQ